MTISRHKNGKIIFVFIVSSILVSFTPRKEIFPLFDWALFARIPKTYVYQTLLITNEKCGLSRTPFWLLPEKGNELYLIRELWRDNTWKIPEWRKKVNQVLTSTCGQGNFKVESVSVRGDTLVLWKTGKWMEVKHEHGFYSASQASP